MPDSASRSSSGLPADDRRLPPHDLYLKIATQIRHFFQDDLNDFPLEIEGKILRIEVKIPELEPLIWLARQESDVKTYWVDREGKFTMAGVGALDIVAGNVPIDYHSVFARLRQCLSPLFPQVRYYGGIGFSQELSIDPSWQLFGNYRFIIPKFEIWLDGIDTYFACNFRLDLSGDSPIEHVHQRQQKLKLILQELAQLNLTQADEPDSPQLIDFSLPKLRERVDSPDVVDWHHNISTALTKFTDFNLDKIVLARQSTLTFTATLQPQSILLALRSHNPLSYHFCFQINPSTAFIGTSPERLYHRQDRFLKTEAIAGTRHRGRSIQIDRELSDNLRNSAKDLREHQLVVQNLRGILTELCQSVTIDGQSTILKLSKVQHLYTQCQGVLKSHLTDAEILPQLHPTPAVGGFPREHALQLIQRLEPFERGWYAAPVGWVSYDATEFAVAIRSGLIDRDRLLLFAGAGIVQGSQAEEEWAEIENKICHFTDLFAQIPPQQMPDSSIAIT
jgi:menaquinone-specific isochorismate synthase